MSTPNNPEHLTPFGRALAALNIRHIPAHSPQAKGRVERVNRTLQDRLLRALREQNICSIDQANTFLEHHYMIDHNRRFAHPDGLTDIHRPAQGIDLDNIFCVEEHRSVNYDWTITVHAQFIQLLRSEVPLPPPRSKVIIRHWLDGTLHIFWNEHELTYKVLPRQPHHARRVPLPPAANHPWRGKPVGGITARRRAEKTLALKKTKAYNATTSANAQRPGRKGSARYARSAFPSTTAAP